MYKSFGDPNESAHPVVNSAPIRRRSLVEEESTHVIVGRHGSYRAAWLGNWPGRSLGTKVRFRRASDSAGRNASEAGASLESEVVDADPLVNRGRPHEWGRNRQAPVRSTGVLSTACRKSGLRKFGRPGTGGGRTSNIIYKDGGRTGSRRGSHVPWMSGNAGGGKDPCFWCAGERGSRAVIDDESTTPRNTDDLSIPLCRSAKREILGVVARHHAVGTGRVGAAVKPVGKLDVRNGHVQFDERGRETIGAYVAPVKRPSSTLRTLQVACMQKCTRSPRHLTTA